MQVSEIAAILGALKSAAELVRVAYSKIKAKEDMAETLGQLQSSLLEVQTGLITLQNEYGRVVEENRQLNSKLQEYDVWDREQTNYELKAIAKGVFVYMLRPEFARGTPVHWVCANCFQNRTKSILQLTKQVAAGDFYICPKCRTELCDHSHGRSPQLDAL